MYGFRCALQVGLHINLASSLNCFAVEEHLRKRSTIEYILAGCLFTYMLV